MRNGEWLQKLLYLIMIVLGVYIICKGGGILLSDPAAESALDRVGIQHFLEDAAMRTYAPGYTATVEGRKNPGWFSLFMNQAVPVYSYVADKSAENAGETDSVEGKEKSETEDGIKKTVETTEEEKETDEGAEDGSEIVETTEEGKETAEINDGTEVSVGAVEEKKENAETEGILEAAAIGHTERLLREQMMDFSCLLNQFYTVDSGTSADAALLDGEVLLSKDLRIEQNPAVPQILIYHTHSQEAFADSKEGDAEDTIVGMGDVLAGHLRAYGYQVIHDAGTYDLVDGVLDRSAAYDYARNSIEQILAENPTIEVIIDLHRDGVEGKKFVTEIDGKPCSMIMFFNGISRNNLDEPLTWLENPYIQENLAFSLQLQLKARTQYPGFTRNIYLKAERFNLHLRPRSLLIEAGTQLNTVEEERNAMKPLADLLHQVLSGE